MVGVVAPSAAPAFVAYGIKEPSVHVDEEDAGIAIPAAMAFIGMVFVSCVLLLTGLPPLAGFLEAGESIEEAVHREVYEEVGLTVTNLQYFGSQSWPFPHSLMIAFTADYAGGEIRVDPTEIAEARWFGPDDEWPERVPHISVSSVLVDAHRPPDR